MVKIDHLESLPERMAQHEKLFNEMLHLIPAKYYIAQKQEFNNSPYMHNKRKLKAPKQEIKERSKKARKAKLDPENEKSIAELQSEQAEQVAKEKAESQTNNDDEEDEEDDESQAVDDDDVDEDDNDDVASNSSISLTKGDFSGLDGKPEIVLPTEPAKPMVRSDIADLHDRLQQRIAQMRQNRNAPKAKSREEILKQRAKKREDRKKAQKQQKEKRSGGQGPAEELVKVDNSTKRSAADSVKMDGDLFFGKVALGEQKKKGSIDAKQQLKKIESQKEKLEQLRKEDKQKASQVEEKEQWDRALALASGEKIKDDTKLLKKTIKHKEQQKRKSADEWRKRLDKVKMDEKAKIKKREDNIRNHTKAKKTGENRKKKGSKGNDGKKKKARHGFEGAAFGYGGKVSKSKKK